MKLPAEVFVDSGAWIALAITSDPYHSQARSTWESLSGAGVKWVTSIPVVIETFTFLDRNATRPVAVAWRTSVDAVKRLKLAECTARDLAASWRFFEQPGFHKLSAVDATSFAVMHRLKVRTAFTFDRHFAIAGFRLAS